MACHFCDWIGRLTGWWREPHDSKYQKTIVIITNIIVQTVPVEKIYLFGSYAYGTPQPDSDLDIYVVIKDDTPMRDIEAGQLIDHALYGKKSISTDLIIQKKARFTYQQCT
jgi:predicted nucleotidyltransferase